MSRRLFIVIWIIMLPLFVIGSLLSLALPLTAIIEGIVVLIYARARNYTRFTLLTLVTAINLLTQPALWFIVSRQSNGISLGVLVIIECFIWLVEAVLIYGLQRHKLSFAASLKLSALLNIVSFAIGLLLPV